MDEVIFATITVVALLLSGLIGTVETALGAVSRARAEELRKEERRGASELLRILDRRADHINLLVLLRTILDVAAAVFATSFFVHVIDPNGWAIFAAIAVVSLISFMVIGVFSRTMGRKNPYTISLNVAVVLGAIGTVLGPIARLLIKVGNIFAPGEGFRDGPYATEIELRELVDIAQEHGIVEIEERRMIQNVFDLAGTTTRQVMVPRPEMVWIEGTKNAGQATSLCVRSGYSRLPVIGENVDDIKGVVYLKDLVAKTYQHTDGGRSVQVEEVMRDAFFVPDSKPLDELLHHMQSTRNHLAMVVDEYGGIAGMVSMEDILEEIVGEIADEYDDEDGDPIEQIAPRTYRVMARTSLEDLATVLKDDLDYRVDFSDEVEDQVDTVAGLATFALGRIPLPGSEITIDGLHLRTESGHDRRGRIKVRHVIVTVEDVPEPLDTESE